MVAATRDLSVDQLQRRQRRERLLGVAALIAAALGFSMALVLFGGPLPLVAVLGALGIAGAIVARPRFGLYLLLFCALFLEQWGIAGIDPVSARLPFYQTLAGAGVLPVPVSPVEMVLIVTLAAVALPMIARRGRQFVRGPLFAPLVLFLALVAASVGFGLAGGGGAGPFDIRAAWEETRAFFYMGITYVLAANLLQTKAQLRTFMWIVIAAIGLKSVQGIVRFVYVRSNGLNVDSIIGHEDVVFFATLVVIAAGLLLFGSKLEATARRQFRAMLVVLPPLVFTLLVTNRRLGFVVLAAGLTLVALLLLKTRRDLFVRLVPVALVAAGVYTVVFWNNTGTLGQPIRAVRSIVAPATERDRSSNAWRELENFNINYNIRTASVTGLGFGRPYSFVVAQPPLDATGFTYWRYIAHNAIYWVWMKMGIFGFMAFWYFMGSAIILGLITFRRLRDGYLKALALAAAGVVIMQVIFSYGDLGLTYTRSMVFLGCMAGMLVRLPAFEERAGADDGVAPTWWQQLRPERAAVEERAR
jgi:hypothetical protein